MFWSIGTIILCLLGLFVVDCQRPPKIRYISGVFDDLKTVMEEKKDALKDFVVSPSTTGDEPIIKVDLALEFGKIDKKDVIRMDNATMFAIYAVTKNFAKTMPHPDFDFCRNQLSSSFFVAPNTTSTDVTSGTVKIADDSAMSKDGSIPDVTKQRIKTELMRVLQDDKNVYNALYLDYHIPYMTKFMHTSSGKKIVDVQWSQVHDQAKVMDVSVLRYPDVDAQYFKLYRLEIIAIRSSEFGIFKFNKNILKADDTNILTFDYHKVNFAPRISFFKKFDQEKHDLVEKVEKKALAIFNITST